MRRAFIIGGVYILAALAGPAVGDDAFPHKFQRQQLTDVYYSEGANAGDLNKDGHADVVYGPYWFAGPDFKVKRELYPAKPQNKEGYADNFFNWVHDFNGDGWNDVFVVGFPGTPAYVYENPKAEGFDKPWPKHTVFDSVSNESPHFTNIVGDDKPELVCTFNGAFGFATIDGKEPFKKWTFHPISDLKAPPKFGHGLGVGDVNGDGLQDLLVANGWFAQPKEDAEKSPWKFHETAFSNAYGSSAYGGAEMYAYDVDGDGDNDVITSLAAHDYGLAWFEQDKSGPEIVFRQHLIMGNNSAQSRYGLVFTEPHSVALADIDGDGLKDIITGKTYYSHHKQSPLWDAGAVVYCFRLVRTKEGVGWVPYKLDGEAGIGRQISVVDVNGDKLPDIVVGGMVGAHVLLHQKDRAGIDAPKALTEIARPLKRGPFPDLNKPTERLGVEEGEGLTVLKVSMGVTSNQEMANFAKDRWSGGKQLFWSGAKPGEKLELEFEVKEPAKYKVLGAFTMARDYGIVQVTLDGEALGGPLDLHNFPDVISTGALTLGSANLKTGKHRVVLEFKGANPAAVKADKIGLDYLQFVGER